MVRKAIASGGSTYKEPIDMGFMYQHGFQDLNGHIWEILLIEGKRSFNSLKTLYLLLAIAGSILPWFWLLQDSAALMSPTLFLQRTFAHQITTAWTSDLLISSIVFFIFAAMKMQIEPYQPHHLDAVIDLSLRAWTPVFESIQKAMDADVYQAFYPDSWGVSQQKAVEDVCADEDINVWVAIDAGTTVGFVAMKLDSASSMGEIYMVAVDPDFQGRGIGSALTKFAIERMKEAGMSMAMVETGGDPGHAPARRTYEKLGFGLLPISRYFKKL